MARIARKERLTSKIVRMEILAHEIAVKRRAGQFVILRVNEKGERIPLTIVDSDTVKGTITIVFQVVGKTTSLLAELKEGENIQDVAGPLGKPTDIETVGKVIVVGGGIGIAVAYPIAKAMKDAGNQVISILGARTQDLLVLEEEVAAVSDRIIVTTDDGSYKRKGLVSEPLVELLNREPVDRVIAIGPVPMMEAVSTITGEYGVKTIVSLNPIMVDGTGMCGACRVMIGGKTKFACVDGPEFDGHQVDFGDLATRLGAYREQERQAWDLHRIGKAREQSSEEQ
jgi:ferredoxin--NADP+ reductase